MLDFHQLPAASAAGTLEPVLGLGQCRGSAAGGTVVRFSCTLPDVDGTVQQRVIASLPAAAKYGLEPPPRSVRTPARELTDRTRLADVLAEHAGAYPGASGPVILTLWWYLASAVLVGPPAAGALLGVPLSGALTDLDLHLGPVGMPAAAVSSAVGPADPGPALGATLAALIDTACSVGGLRPRPLWALVIDSLADRLLTFGRAIGGVPRASALATELTISTGAPVPPPRFFDVTTDAGTDDRRSARRTARFLIRTSCCLLHRIPPAIYAEHARGGRLSCGDTCSPRWPATSYDRRRERCRRRS